MAWLGVFFGRRWPTPTLSERRIEPASANCQTVGPQSGYAAIDAMVALMILAFSIIFSLQATGQARVAGEVAWETRRAQTLLGHLIATAPRRPEPAVGESDGFAWRVETQMTGAERPIAICRRDAQVLNDASRRVYRASTLEICPIETPA